MQKLREYVSVICDFLQLSGHELLYDYGLPDDKIKVNQDDADVNLVPDLVEKVVVPILQHAGSLLGYA
ncbi:hypothetical protein L1987_37040 [Smallanthus sonchifolius]|uniref:Uncharacterized protein n=1 Tax=Smallanthus sonchifolius TaxID=185202 RepID=A0ACB9HEU6_9ASTR|nr:hypothetical protein L1987_37040 [Smallanthus sonchifolius]